MSRFDVELETIENIIQLESRNIIVKLYSCIPIGSEGEKNTASNAGAGISLFYQKSGVDLQFNGIKSEDEILSISLDAITHDIEAMINENNIDHNNLANTHNLTSDISHSSISDLDVDSHTQYALLTGRSGGQTIIGGNDSGDDIILQTTSNAAKGDYIFSEMTSAGFLKNTSEGILSGGNSINSGDINILKTHPVMNSEDTDYLAVSQSPAGPGDLILVGVPYNYPRKLTATSITNNAGITITFYGTNEDGDAASEGITGPNNETVETSGWFLTCSQISVSGAAADIECGIGDAMLIIDRDDGNIHKVTIAAITTLNLQNLGSVDDLALRISNGGDFAITWDSAIDWPGGNAPTLTTSGRDWIVFVTEDSGVTVDGCLTAMEDMQ